MPPWLRTALFAAARVGLLVLAGSWGGAYLLQRELLYPSEPASIDATLATAGLRAAAPWPDRADFRGVRVEPATLEATGTVLVFHGNAGHAGHRAHYAEALGHEGWRVILVEYPGYGAREGQPSEAAFAADAADLVARARHQYGGRLVLAGESLGAAVAAAAVAQATARGLRIDGLLLLTPWDELAHAVSHHLPWLPAKLLLADRYECVANLRGFQGPTVVVIAADDEVVPPRLAEALFERLDGRKTLFAVPAAGHNDWPDRVDPTWWRRVSAALAEPD